MRYQPPLQHLLHTKTRRRYQPGTLPLLAPLAVHQVVRKHPAERHLRQHLVLRQLPVACMNNNDMTTTTTTTTYDVMMMMMMMM